MVRRESWLQRLEALWLLATISTAALDPVWANSATAQTVPQIEVVTSRGCGDQAVFAGGEYLDFTVRLLNTIEQPQIVVQVSIVMSTGQLFTTSGSLSNALPERTFSGPRQSFEVPPVPGPGTISARAVWPGGAGDPVSCTFVTSLDATPPPSVAVTGTSSPTPTPTATPTRPPASATPSASVTAPPARGDGDANCDGRLGAADVARYAILIGTQTRAACARDDIDGDGVLDAGDLRAAIAAIFAAAFEA